MTTISVTERGTQQAIGVQVLDYCYVVPTNGTVPYHEFLVGTPTDPPDVALSLVTRDALLIQQAVAAYVTGERQDAEYRHAVRTADGKRLEQLVALWRSV